MICPFPNNSANDFPILMQFSLLQCIEISGDSYYTHWGSPRGTPVGFNFVDTDSCLYSFITFISQLQTFLSHPAKRGNSLHNQ